MKRPVRVLRLKGSRNREIRPPLLSGAICTNCNCGTIFRITPAGEETVLYSFGTSANDGKQPSGALLQASDGNFYGTTGSGGPSNDGTVFKLVLGAN
jgi:uncharacterized repeat protein (TIGR03803 family)